MTYEIATRPGPHHTFVFYPYKDIDYMPKAIYKIRGDQLSMEIHSTIVNIDKIMQNIIERFGKNNITHQPGKLTIMKNGSEKFNEEDIHFIINELKPGVLITHELADRLRLAATASIMRARL